MWRWWWLILAMGFVGLMATVALTLAMVVVDFGYDSGLWL